MVHDIQAQSKLQELELAHADEGQLADIRRSDALTAESHDLEKGYFLSVGLVGSVAGISLSTVAAYFVSKKHTPTNRHQQMTDFVQAFSPPAAIISTINADIGRYAPKTVI